MRWLVELLPAFGLGIACLAYHLVLKPLWKRIDKHRTGRKALISFKAIGAVAMVVALFPVALLFEWLPAWYERFSRHTLIARRPWVGNAFVGVLALVGYCAVLAIYLWGTEGWDWGTYVSMLELVSLVVAVIAVPIVLFSLGARWHGYAKRWKRVAGRCATAGGILWVGGLAALMFL